MFSSQHHFLRNLAKFPWAGSFKHGSQMWAGREWKKESDTSTKVIEYNKRYIVQGDQIEVTDHLLILRLYITHWTKMNYGLNIRYYNNKYTCFQSNKNYSTWATSFGH
jgi:hypothetical protein